MDHNNGGHQMEVLIREATKRVAMDGRNAEFVDIHLASIGYLSREINKPHRWSLTRIAPAAFTSGAAFGAGILAGLVRLLGG